MPRYKLTIEYHGAAYCGWQRQDNGYGVQQALEEAVRNIEPTVDKITAAGRTDAGVHATGQVVHLDAVRDWAPFDLAKAINHFLSKERVSVVEVERVGDEFHARFDARARLSSDARPWLSKRVSRGMSVCRSMWTRCRQQPHI